jgi:hypothetical protein
MLGLLVIWFDISPYVFAAGMTFGMSFWQAFSTVFRVLSPAALSP